MKPFKSLSIIALAFMMATPLAEAKPARRDLMTVKQPDGTELQVRLTGDEHLHFLTTADGTLLVRDAEGWYNYARLEDDGALISTGVKASRNVAPGALNISQLDIKNIEKTRSAAGRKSRRVPMSLNKPMADTKELPQTGMGLCATTYPRTGSPKGLIILVEYADVSFTLSDAKSYFDDMINGENFTQYGGTGSALSYFTDQSLGIFKPSFDVYGPVKLSQNRAYYGGNDRWGDDLNPQAMVTEAVRDLDATVDFSVYDTDKDGVIDNVYIFYAGVGEADSYIDESVWPHSWDVREAGVNLIVDGVRVGHYACSNEWSNYLRKPDGIGTFVHEFSHVMGLPDLYNTVDGYATYTPDEYSVLDAGCYLNNSRTPPCYTAYERNAMGWGEPVLIENASSQTLEHIATGRFAIIQTEKPTEFFLLENRQKTGWDKYIPGHGMLIWHIDYVESVFEGNTVNNTEKHQYVDIVEANNRQHYDYNAGWTFPGTSKVTSFTADTNPAFKSWAGNAISLPLTNITEANGLITFDVAGGKPDFDSPQPEATVVNTDGKYYFTASWAPVEGATDYLVSVYAVGNGNVGQTTNGFDGSQLGDGWSSSKANAWYSTSGNYGEASPSYRFDATNQTLTSPALSSDITKISFWSKGQSTNGSSLNIEGYKNGEWVTITNYTPKSNQIETANFDVPSGICQVRFKYIKSSGNFAIDDIVLTYGDRDQILSDYNKLSTGGATSVTVDKLLPDKTSYYFTVTAIDGDKKSNPSEKVYVDMNSDAGVGDVIADVDDNSPVVYYNLQGIRLTSAPAAGAVVICRKGNKVYKMIIR